MSSDMASGVVSFESGEDVAINEATVMSSVESQAELRVVRAPGVYGVVSVPYKVTMVGSQHNVTDLTPTSGYITLHNMQVNNNSFTNFEFKYVWLKLYMLIK